MSLFLFGIFQERRGAREQEASRAGKSWRRPVAATAGPQKWYAQDSQNAQHLGVRQRARAHQEAQEVVRIISALEVVVYRSLIIFILHRYIFLYDFSMDLKVSLCYDFGLISMRI